MKARWSELYVQVMSVSRERFRRRPLAGCARISPRVTHPFQRSNSHACIPGRCGPGSAGQSSLCGTLWRIMHVELMPAEPDDRERLLAMFELYIYDFSELLGLTLGDDGRFHPPD